MHQQGRVQREFVSAIQETVIRHTLHLWLTQSGESQNELYKISIVVALPEALLQAQACECRARWLPDGIHFRRRVSSYLLFIDNFYAQICLFFSFICLFSVWMELVRQQPRTMGTATVRPVEHPLLPAIRTSALAPATVSFFFSYFFK